MMPDKYELDIFYTRTQKHTLEQFTQAILAKDKANERRNNSDFVPFFHSPTPPWQ